MRPIDAIKEQLNHGCDGPITPFVLISRAIRLATNAPYIEGYSGHPENIANALDELLTEYGWLKNGIVETGS